MTIILTSIIIIVIIIIIIIITTTTTTTIGSKYIDKCMQQRSNPRASLMIRKNVSKDLVLNSLGMGDTMAENLAGMCCYCYWC